MKQESFGNVKKMQKQNPILSLVYIINARSEGREIVNLSLISLSLIVNLVNFLSIKEINILTSHIFVLSTVINMIFLPFLALITLQLIVGYFYQVQFFISIQWKVFRFTILPFLTCYLLNQASRGTFINPSLSVILFAIVSLTSLVLTATFATESYTYKKLLHRDLPINFYHLIVENLLYACSLLQNYNIKITCSLLVTILAFHIYNNNFTILKYDSLQYRILCIHTFLLLWYGMVLTISLFSGMGNIVSLVIACIPCLFYKIASDMTKQRAPVPYKSFISIFQDPDQIHFQQFIDSVQPIIEQIMDYYYSDRKRDFVETLLISYYYEHSNRCLNVDCPFRNQDYKYELKNMNDSKNMKEVLFKICKKIDFLYYGMYKTWPEHIDLKLSLVQFYIFCFPNKVRALEIISEIELSKLTFQQEYDLFRVKILCQNMDSLELVGQIKLDQRLVQFENLVYMTLNTMMEFWTLFYEQKIDFNKLTSITSKMFPLRKKVEQIFQNRLSQETFSSLQILKLYSQYCAMIQNNEEKSWKIKDYLDKLRSKLEQHKEIQYLSFDSQIGLVALSLSENKLGSIAMVNSQACNIFNYSKKQFKTMRVNEIMPNSFAAQHDNYLKVFLQNRTKKINSDQRKLLGKNKSGYVFPILLQLQRTVSSTGDQLLFIANIKKHKLKHASISCVTDQEGEICEISASFDYLFFKHQKVKKRKHTNIQQFIPEFFDPSIEQDENTRDKHFKQMVNLKSCGKIEIEYTVSQVVFPLKQYGGYIVQGKIVSDQKPIQFPHISMTHSLKTMMNRQILSGHKTFYNPVTNRYELSRKEEPIGLNSQFDKQFTIPFININDVTSIFGIKKDIVIFGEHIKTIRLIKNHFQRVQEASQFESQGKQQKTQSAQAISQINELKQSILKQKKPQFMRNIKLTLLGLTIGCITLCLVLVGSYNMYFNSINEYVHQVTHKFQTRGYLSQYVTYFTALNSGFDISIYHPKLKLAKTILIDSIQNSPILQDKKEEILKIVYLQSEANLTSLLNSETLQFDYQRSDSLRPILLLWYAFGVICFLLIIVTVSSYFFFLNQLESVYQIFMCLEQKIIKKMYMECFKLAKKIEHTSLKGGQKSQPQSNQTNIRNSQQVQDDEQNPVKKVRKFKKDQNFRNFFLFIKLLVPFIIIIVLSVYAIVNIQAHNRTVQKYIQIHRQIFLILPQTSVFMMNTFLKNVHNYTSQVNLNFKQSYQDIDQILYEFQNQYTSSVQESYFITLLDNICTRKIITQSTQNLCQSISQGTMTVGLSKSLNYFANSLINLQYSNSNNLVQNFNEIIILEYDFIFPVIQHMAKMMDQQIKSKSSDLQQQYSTLTIILLILMGLNFIYFTRYPAVQMQEKLILSKGLVDLLPELYKGKSTQTKQGYSKIVQKL